VKRNLVKISSSGKEKKAVRDLKAMKRMMCHVIGLNRYQRAMAKTEDLIWACPLPRELIRLLAKRSPVAINLTVEGFFFFQLWVKYLSLIFWIRLDRSLGNNPVFFECKKITKMMQVFKKKLK